MKNFERQKNVKFLYNVYGCIIKNRCSPGSSRMVISYLFEMLRIHECALKNVFHKHLPPHVFSES